MAGGIIRLECGICLAKSTSQQVIFQMNNKLTEEQVDHKETHQHHPARTTYPSKAYESE
jgi:hypothetical protein